MHLHGSLLDDVSLLADGQLLQIIVVDAEALVVEVRGFSMHHAWRGQVGFGLALGVLSFAFRYGFFLVILLLESFGVDVFFLVGILVILVILVIRIVLMCFMGFIGSIDCSRIVPLLFIIHLFVGLLVVWMTFEVIFVFEALLFFISDVVFWSGTDLICFMLAVLAFGTGQRCSRVVGELRSDSDDCVLLLRFTVLAPPGGG